MNSITTYMNMWKTFKNLLFFEHQKFGYSNPLLIFCNAQFSLRKCISFNVIQ